MRYKFVWKRERGRGKGVVYLLTLELAKEWVCLCVRACVGV